LDKEEKEVLLELVSSGRLVRIDERFYRFK
jgi:hypothetical protein